MSYTIFDCTQIINLNTNNKKSIQNVKESFEKIGFIVNNQEKIEENKVENLKEHLDGTVIELIDKQFMGEFEDWKEVFNPPEKMQEFIKTLVDILNDKDIESLKVIMVASASENEDEDKVLQLVSSKHNLFKDLFSMSAWNFDLNVDILILKFVKN